MKIIPREKAVKTTKGFRLNQYTIDNLDMLVRLTGTKKSDIIANLINSEVKKINKVLRLSLIHI